MSDMLDITEAQARVLRSIAYYEADSGTKGATQYTCSRKVPNGLHVSGSTFNDNIKELEKNLMVLRLKDEKVRIKETKPYTITDIGQIAWLRHFPLSKNMDIIQKIFPNIHLSPVDSIINEIQHSDIKEIRDKYSLGVLEIALDSFHVKASAFNTDYFKVSVQETIELSGFYDLVKTSYRRYYNAIHPLLNKSLGKEKEIPNYDKNFDELEISVVDRITFLFYYNLIQSFLESQYALIVIIKILEDDKIKNIEKKFTNKEITKLVSKYIIKESGQIKDTLQLSLEIVKKKKKMMKLISSNEVITRIIQNNLKNLKEYKSNDNDFENISSLFLKN